MMKKWNPIKRCFSIVLALAMLLSALSVAGVSAAGAAVGEPDTSVSSNPAAVTSNEGVAATTNTAVPYGPVALVQDGKFVFTLLSEKSEMALTFADALNKRTGAKVTVGTATATDAYELVIGKYAALADSTTVFNKVQTAREDNASDYIIEMIGTKIYVAAVTDYALQNALDYFLDEFVKDDQGKISTGYTYTHKPNHVNYTLAGNPIGEYTIRTERYPSQLVQRAAVAVQEFLMENYGWVLEIKAMNTAGNDIGDKEIRIGPMNGAVNVERKGYNNFTQADWQSNLTIESDGLLEGDKGAYKLIWDGNNVQVNGGSVYAISAGVVRLLQVLEEKTALTSADVFEGNYRSAFDYIYGAGYDTVDFSLVDGFGLVYADEFDYTGSVDKIKQAVKSKWTISESDFANKTSTTEDDAYPAEDPDIDMENQTVHPNVYGQNWWVAADTAGNNYLFQVAKTHQAAEGANPNYTYYEGTRLATNQKWGFRYGIWETRLVMGTHNGSSSAVWSHTNDPYSTDTYWHEIDVYENYGQDAFVPCFHSMDETMTENYPHASEDDPENPLLMQGQFDDVIPGGGTAYQSESWETPAAGEHYWNTFHHVSIDWTYDYLRVYLDGEMVSRIILGEDGPEGLYENLFDCYRAGQTIKLSNGVGGRYYSKTRPVSEGGIGNTSYTPEYWLGEAVGDFFEVQLVDYTRVYQTSNADIKYEAAKNDFSTAKNFGHMDTSSNRYGRFQGAQGFEFIDADADLSVAGGIVASEAEHLDGFTSAKVTSNIAAAPQMDLIDTLGNPFSVEAGKDYDMFFYVKVPETEADYNVQYKLTTVDGTVLADTQTLAVTKGHWQKVEIQIRDCAVSGDLRLAVTGTADAATFYIDDVYVEEITIRNADESAINFEGATDGDVLFENANSSVVVSNKKSYSGSQSVLFSSDHPFNNRAQMNVVGNDGKQIKLAKGQDYTLNFKMYIDKAYYSVADQADGNANNRDTLKEDTFTMYLACVPDSLRNTFFSNDLAVANYVVYEENPEKGTARDHLPRNEWLDITVVIEDCPISGNLRLGIGQYAWTQFYAYVDDIKLYNGVQNVTVKFDTNGGAGTYADMTVENGAAIGAIAEPTRDHFRFLGWYSDVNFVDGSYVDPATTAINGVNGDEITLYARWQGATCDYSSDCDEYCDSCGEYRKAIGAHAYDNACDAVCDACGITREVGLHVYDDACDANCNECNAARTVHHVYDNDYDADCNECGTFRSLNNTDSDDDTLDMDIEGGICAAFGHTYSADCDVDCNVCGAVREAADHAYDHDCDTDCNNCGAVRVVGDHAYDNVCDTDCNNCGDVREVPHVYDDAFDTECNVCGHIRNLYTPDIDDGEVDMGDEEPGVQDPCAGGHTYDNDCDAECNVCGDPRTPADHVYDNACDADCNVCGETRTPADHVYDNACDADCNVCGDLRTPADHVYDNACDADCNVCGETRDAGHTYSKNCDETCDVCGAYRDDAAAHTYTGTNDDSCDLCGAMRPKLYSASLELKDRIRILFNVNRDAFTSAGYEKPFVVFQFDTNNDGVLEEFTVTEYDEAYSGNIPLYVFSFTKLAAKMMTDEVKATICGTRKADGKVVEGGYTNYSVLKYCNNQLGKDTNKSKTTFTTVLVDMLNYGALSQLRWNYKTDNLANAGLSELQQSWATSDDDLTLTEFQGVDQSECSNAAGTNTVARWRGFTLMLEDAVTVGFTLYIDNPEDVYGLTYEITAAGKTTTWTPSVNDAEDDILHIEDSGDYYTIYFRGMDAKQMREKIYIKAYNKDGEVVTATVYYSIESYAARNKDKVGTAEKPDYTGALVKAMMKYGDATKAHFG